MIVDDRTVLLREGPLGSGAFILEQFRPGALSGDPLRVGLPTGLDLLSAIAGGLEAAMSVAGGEGDSAALFRARATAAHALVTAEVDDLNAIGNALMIASWNPEFGGAMRMAQELGGMVDEDELAAVQRKSAPSRCIACS